MSIKIIDIYNSMEKLSSNLDILEKRIRKQFWENYICIYFHQIIDKYTVKYT